MEINLQGQRVWPEEPSGEPPFSGPVTFHTPDLPPLESLHDRPLVVLGFGLQGEPLALNARDAGAQVTVALRAGSPSLSRVASAGLPTHDLMFGVPADCDTILVCLPDDVQPEVMRRWILPSMRPGQLLLFAHGYALIYGQLAMPQGVDVAVLAPHGTGAAVRQGFLNGAGVGAQLAVWRDPSGSAQARALTWAHAFGFGPAGIRSCTVAQEVALDLFVEEALLCGGLVELCRATYEAAVASGYDPVQVYRATFGEIGNTAELLQEHGPVGMYRRISQIAMRGSLLNGRRGLASDAEARLQQLLRDIEAGTIVRQLLEPAMQSRLAAVMAELKALRATITALESGEGQNLHQ
ncbi:MAG: Ketol-acid reductoisomerase (NADP(+)) [bacterium]|nr:Ketol-acid reductoisomerase (NADP(+)) [bacterium]